MITEKGLEVASPVALYRRGQRPAGLLDDGGDEKAWDHGAVGIAADHVIGDDLLADDDGATRRIGGLDREAEVTPEMRIAGGIRALDVHDGDVRLERADGQQARSIKGILDRPHARMAPHDVTTDPGEGRQVGQTHRRRLERQPDREVRMVFHHDPTRLALLVGATKTVARSTRDIAHPGRDYLRHRAGRDQLIEGHVRDRPDERQILSPLADDLVHGGERNARFECSPSATASPSWTSSRIASASERRLLVSGGSMRGLVSPRTR